MITGQIDALQINGLYHANAKTEMISSDRLRDFVNALAEVTDPTTHQPEFDIDKNNTNATLVTFSTVEADPNSFAQKFSMHLKLKTPIRLQPEVGK